MHPLVKILLVFAGGAVGALLRVLLLAASLWSGGPSGQAVGLGCVNVLGAFLLGWLLSRVAAGTRRADAARLLLGTGALGGFTSYSSLILLALPLGGAFPAGLGLAVLSLVLGIVAAGLGIRLGKRDTGQRDTARDGDAADGHDGPPAEPGEGVR